MILGIGVLQAEVPVHVGAGEIAVAVEEDAPSSIPADHAPGQELKLEALEALAKNVWHTNSDFSSS